MTVRLEGRKCSLLKAIWEFLWGEWWFWFGHPNGGTVIFWRAVQISVVPVYLLGLWLHSYLGAECPPCHFTRTALEHALDTTLPWLAATFGAIWAGLYARFASQWTYLAGEYNQIRQMLATQSAKPTAENEKHVQRWRAGFVEDALDLHLATKPMFRPFIKRLLDDPKHQEVRDCFDEAVDGKERRAWLQRKLR